MRLERFYFWQFLLYPVVTLAVGVASWKLFHSFVLALVVGGTSVWIVQQLREAFPYGPTTKFLLLDHDAKYGIEVPNAIRSMNINPVRTAVGCPWQNGVAERWVGSCRRELLDQVIAINESHLKRLLSSYIDYYHQDRTQVVSGSKLLKIENTAPAEAR